MKRWILTLAVALPLLLVACGGNGGSSGPPPVFTYYSADTPQLIPDLGNTFSDILVTRGPLYVSRVEVTVAILHTEVSDLDLVLESADGTQVYLVAEDDTAGEDFWYTTFTEDAIVGIWETDASDSPRTGYYLPVEDLDFWLYGEDPHWYLDPVCS